jgi:lipopolysaccharide transport system ATP-binding protein
VYGRVSSLLEVGTGFHPELTGRENIYMNAAILGMKRHEIQRKFDEIVEFAGVERFIDTPVKRYSSGMYVRLAFSVAAHLEPDILIVDEVLTVGDAEFQKRSLGKMDTASKQGRTILFVSHNLGALAALCPRSILLRSGQKIMDDKTAQVIAEYVKTTAEHSGERVWLGDETAPGNEKVRLRRVRILSDGKVTSDVDIVKDVQLEFEFWNFSPGEKLSFGILVLDKMGTEVMASANFRSANLVEDAWTDRPFEMGLFRVSCMIPGNLLNAGRYTIDLYINSNVLNNVLLEHGVISFNVYESGAMREEYQGLWRGVVRPKLAWHTEYIEPLHAMETIR